MQNRADAYAALSGVCQPAGTAGARDLGVLGDLSAPTGRAVRDRHLGVVDELEVDLAM